MPCTLSHAILHPDAPALEIGINKPQAFGRREIDHHDRPAALVSNQIARAKSHNVTHSAEV
jgi:hypothetical protein